MDIIEIAKQIELKNSKYPNSPLKWEKPQAVTNYTLPDVKIVMNRSRICCRRKLAKVLAFIDLKKHIRYTDSATVMNIASTGKRLLSICGSQQNASNLISYMKEIGLIGEYNVNYQFGGYSSHYNYSKQYIYYYENEQIIKKYCEDNKINRYIIRNYNRDNNNRVVTIDNFDNDKVRFNSKVHLLKPDNYSIKQFEEYLTNVLYDNYPQLSYYQALADEINDSYYFDEPELQISFIPTFTWSKDKKAVRKIGIRATNTYVSAKCDKNDTNEDFKGYYKDDILEEYGLNLSKDVSSSVPRLTLSLNSREWISEDIDMYEIIFNEYENIKSQFYPMETIAQKFSDIREYVKSLHMRGYFDTESMIGVHTRHQMEEVTDAAAVDIEMTILKKAIEHAEGDYLFDSEIFLHESCIYMEVQQKLLERGYFIWTCYDAWYGRKEGVTQEQFEEEVRELIEESFYEYITNYNIWRN